HERPPLLRHGARDDPRRQYLRAGAPAWNDRRVGLRDRTAFAPAAARCAADATAPCALQPTRYSEDRGAPASRSDSAEHRAGSCHEISAQLVGIHLGLRAALDDLAAPQDQILIGELA